MDHLGSTRVVTDDGGVIVSQHDFFPFGEEVQSIFDYNTKLFTGHERDRETGLDYMLARYYGDDLPRFMSPDPGESWDENEPQSWNLYTYVGNNPLAYFDPNGEAMVYNVAKDDTHYTSAQMRSMYNITNPGHLNGFTYMDPAKDVETGVNMRTGVYDVYVDILILMATDLADPYQDVLKHEQLHVQDIKDSFGDLDQKITRKAQKIERKAQRKGWSKAKTDAAVHAAVKKVFDRGVKKMAKKYAKKKKKLDPNSHGIDPDGPFGPMPNPCAGQLLC